MTSLRKRLVNILTELKIIKEAIAKSGRYPPCCLEIKKGMISCDYLGALPEKEFLEKCQECQTEIKEILASLNFKTEE